MSKEGSQENAIESNRDVSEESILQYFEFRGEFGKENTKLLLEQAYKLLHLSLGEEGSRQITFNIGEDAYTLAYFAFPYNSGVRVRLGLFSTTNTGEIKNTSMFNKSEASYVRVSVNFEKGWAGGEVSTSPAHEGKGFGSAMLIMQEGIIKDILKRYADRIHSGLRVEIVDNSRSQIADKNYEGWTSALAKKMGYKEFAGGKFEKYYKSVD